MASLIPNRCAGGLGKCHLTAAGAEHGSVSPPRRRTSPAEMGFPRQGLPAGLGGAGGGGLHQRSQPPKGNLRPSGVWGLLFTRSRRFRALAPQGPTQETKAAEDGRWGGWGVPPVADLQFQHPHATGRGSELSQGLHWPQEGSRCLCHGWASPGPWCWTQDTAAYSALTRVKFPLFQGLATIYLLQCGALRLQSWAGGTQVSPRSR